jgi:hypothetical protein
MQTFTNGMTVADLKQILSTCAEIDENGDPCQVWVGTTRGLSSEVHTFTPLNFRFTGSESSFDILLSV